MIDCDYAEIWNLHRNPPFNMVNHHDRYILSYYELSSTLVYQQLGVNFVSCHPLFTVISVLALLISCFKRPVTMISTVHVHVYCAVLCQPMCFV